MSATIASLAEQCLVRACWSQWRVLQGDDRGAGGDPCRSIVDPEALVLASLSVRRAERRLQDMLAWWARSGARLLSVQRLNTLRRAFPGELLDGGVEWFASLAYEAKDARWRALADANRVTERVRPGKGPSALRLLEPGALMLRLRAGFGVGAKADVMTFLIGTAAAGRTPSIWSTTQVVAAATGYSRPSVARTISEMSLAGLVRSSADRPPRHAVDVAAWGPLLGAAARQPYQVAERVDDDGDDGWDVPEWCFWSHVLSFLATCIDWERSAESRQAAPVVMASHARDICEQFEPALGWIGLPTPDPRQLGAGEEFLAGFRGLVEAVAEWSESRL